MSSRNRQRLITLFVWLLAFQYFGRVCANESALSSRRLLIDGEVLNANTGKLIDSFRVLPGVRYNRAPGTRGTVAVWQPHMIREMSNGKFQWPRTRGYDEMRFRIEADGFRPATTTWLGKGGPHLRMKVHLRPDSGIEGVVLQPDGSPAIGAILAVGLPNRVIRLDGCTVVGHGKPLPERPSDRWRVPRTVTSDENGQFLLPFETDRSAMLCVVHPSGYYEQLCVDFTDSIAEEMAEETGLVQLQLQKWGRVEGRVWWKDTAGKGEVIRATVHRNEPYPGLIQAFDKTTAGADGRYLFEYLPPGDVQFGHEVKPSTEPTKPALAGLGYEYPVQHATLTAGHTETLDFGGDGANVVGRLAGLDSYENVTISIRPPAPDVWGLRRFGNGGGADKLQAGYVMLQSADYAPLYFRSGLPVDKDGSFRIEDVMTGQYNLWVSGATGSGQFTLQTSHEDPQDIGTIPVKAK